MSDAAKKARLKADVRVISGGPDPLTDPLPQQVQGWLDLYVQEHPQWSRTQVEHELRLQKWRLADLKGALEAVIKAGEEVEVVGHGGYMEGTPEAERPVWVRNGQGLNGWTKLGNLEPLP
jgi:hypothetical protein